MTYDVAYSLVTVSNGAPVTNTNSAYALAHCKSCTTVAVSFQVVLIVGHSKDIAPINAAGSLNYDCPACTTTAIADQLVVTLKSQPTAALLAKLDADLKQLNAVAGAGRTGNAGGGRVAGGRRPAADRDAAQRQRAADGPDRHEHEPRRDHDRAHLVDDRNRSHDRPDRSSQSTTTPPAQSTPASTTPAPASTPPSTTTTATAPATSTATTSTATTTTPSG